jgi:hypothetical protein
LRSRSLWSAAIDVAAVAKRDKGQFIPTQVEFVNNTIIADAEAEFRSSLQSFVREILQAPPQVLELGLDTVLMSGGKTEEDRGEFAGVNLRGLLHEWSTLTDAHTTFA